MKQPWVIAALCLGLCAGAAAESRWSSELLEAAAKLPVQDGGRVKPFDTFAQFTMLRINGKRSLTLEDGTRLKPVAWALDCIFHPEKAEDYPCFIVDNVDAVTAIGINTHGERRSRYSYNELLPGRQKLAELGMQYSQIDAKQRNLVEQQVLNLAQNVMQFELLTHYLEMSRARFKPEPDTALAAAFPEAEGALMSAALERIPKVLMALRETSASLGEEQLNKEVSAISGMLDRLEAATRPAQALALFPPADPAAKEWLTSGGLALKTLESLLQFRPQDEQALAWLAGLERLAGAVDAPAAFEKEFYALGASVTARAESRGEFARVPLEYFFYKSQMLFYSQWLFVLSFLLIAVSWMMPQGKWIHRITPVAVSVPLILLIVGITLRCIIRNRPPVSTLYETILFITAVAVLTGLIIEWMNRQRISLAMSSFLGALGMFLAFRYEAKEGVDTMPSLVAVLDTNFWLSTHVTTVTMGYAAALLAGALAHIYIFGKLFGFRKNDAGFYKSITRMVYGVICFGLLFAVIGTILGGIWANDSWGRFWGWDPKENGALMICLWGLFILHARMGGYIRDMGISMCAIVLGGITAFSWWGVNLLGVGLHSYGFTSGIMNLLVLFWGVETLVLACGAIAWFREQSGQAAASGHKKPAKGRTQTA